MSAWTALPERDRALLLWLVQGDVVTAELAALLAYGHRRIAQRRLARLVDYGIVTGFWAANRQRPRGRYAYALTKPARLQLERLVWPDGKPKIGKDGIETVSPVIHQLATHDLFGAFLRATDPAREVGISAWAPERACVRLNWDGYLRPDALAVIRVGDASIVMFVERDLGTERGGTLSQKVFKYGNVYGNRESTGPLHVGLVVDTARRAASVRRHVDDPKTYKTSVRVWVTTEPALSADPYGCVWASASGEDLRTLDLAPHWTGDPWAILQPLCLVEPDNLEGLDERVHRLRPAPSRGRSVLRAGRTRGRVRGTPTKNSGDRFATTGATQSPCSRAGLGETQHHYVIPLDPCRRTKRVIWTDAISPCSRHGHGERVASRIC